MSPHQLLVVTVLLLVLLVLGMLGGAVSVTETFIM